MIPLDKLKSLQRAYVHANCPDGTASALILKDALPDLEVHFVKYDSQEHREIEPLPNTIFCDFSPYIGKGEINKEPGSVLDMWIQEEVIVLDHHSRDIVEPYPFGVFGENDKLECGAMLAYLHVWIPVQRSYLGAPRQPGDPSCRGREAMEVENFARLAAIRDTWQRNHGDWDAANEQAAELMFWKFEQLNLDTCTPGLSARLFERQIELANSCIKEAFVFRTEKGTKVLMFQGVSATSDAAELLDNQPELVPNLVVGFHYRFDGGSLKLQFSTRSHTGFDCQAFARAHGGNGHKEAAGFTVEAGPFQTNPYAVFGSILGKYEAKL